MNKTEDYHNEFFTDQSIDQQLENELLTPESALQMEVKEYEVL